MLQQTITDGSALAKLAEFIKAQGGDPAYIYDPSLFQLAEIREEICAKESGFLQKIVCDEVGICSLLLGGGREKKEDTIDPAVGLVLHKKKGDKVQAGESLATIYANDPEKLLQEKSQILLVDDSKMNRMILAEILGDGYHILEAENGQECLEKLRAEAGNIALVLLDINMPVMDGFEVLKAMNANHTIEDIPVIMISSEDSDAAIRRSYELGRVIMSIVPLMHASYTAA